MRGQRRHPSDGLRPLVTFPVTIYNLPLEWLQKIETTGDPGMSYQVKALTNRCSQLLTVSR
jgi:hypothetical protein